jgi:hypothetical protein
MAAPPQKYSNSYLFVKNIHASVLFTKLLSAFSYFREIFNENVTNEFQHSK